MIILNPKFLNMIDIAIDKGNNHSSYIAIAESSEFSELTKRLSIVRSTIQEIEEMNQQVASNDKMQKKEVDHAKKVKRDKETQELYQDLKNKFTGQLSELEKLEEVVKDSKMEEKEKEVLLTNVRSAYVNLDSKLKESHKIYSEYRKNFKDVLVRQFMNIDSDGVSRNEVERLVDEDPNVPILFKAELYSIVLH